MVQSGGKDCQEKNTSCFRFRVVNFGVPFIPPMASTLHTQRERKNSKGNKTMLSKQAAHDRPFVALLSLITVVAIPLFLRSLGHREDSADGSMFYPRVHRHALDGMRAHFINGTECDLVSLAGKYVTIVVNVASYCAFTELNYRELQWLYDSHRSEGLQILAFPCNQFGNQEPDAAASIERFARLDRRATFPVMEKVDVNGPMTHPLFKVLKAQAGVDPIEWNFGKFILGRGGVLLGYYDHRFPFEVIKQHVKQLIILGAGLNATAV